MSADQEKERLPFEPKRKRQKVQKTKPSSSQSVDSSQSNTSAKAQSSSSVRRYSRDETSIPEVVSRRMFKRMIFFSGIPVSLGLLMFFASYVIITQGIAELPNVAVLLTTLLCFGLSVVGLSYGALSASWEEETVGTLFGIEQFQVNFERLLGSWRQAREERREKAGEKS